MARPYPSATRIVLWHTLCMATTPKQAAPLRMGKQGRIVVPADIRAELGLDEGVRLVARVIDGELRILTYRANLERIRRRIREHIPADRGLVDELIADRRAEAALEEAKDAGA